MAAICRSETALQKQGFNMSGHMTASRAAEILGLVNGSRTDPDAIQAAFVAKVKEAHPDLGGLGDVHSITQARNVLLRACRGEIKCRQCGGTGSIRGRIGVTL